MMEILDIRDIRTVPDQYHMYTPDLRNSAVPIVFDNGEKKVLMTRQTKGVIIQ